MSEYYKIIEKIECISTCRYCVHGAPYCFSGFFRNWDRRRTSTPCAFHLPREWRQLPISRRKGIKESKSKIKNGISKKQQRENMQGPIFVSQWKPRTWNVLCFASFKMTMETTITFAPETYHLRTTVAL